MRYITNGQSYSVWPDRGAPPAGTRFVTAAEYQRHREKDAAGFQEKREAYIAHRKSIKSSARAKLIAGEPLTEEEADTLLR